MATLWQDLRYGIRTLTHKPGFTAVAVLTLALGLGANTAIFSVVNAVLLRPSPYRDAEKLATVWETDSKRRVDKDSVAPPNFLDWRDQQRVFEHIAAFTARSFSFTGAGNPATFSSSRFNGSGTTIRDD